jgi:hypothetical protein
MTKLRKKIDKLPGQMGLFDVIKQVSERQKVIFSDQDAPGRLNIDCIVKDLVASALKKAPKDRYWVAAEMSKKLGREITKSQLDSWSAGAKINHGIKVVDLSALIETTGDNSILHLLCEKAGGFFVQGRDALYTELGRIDRQKKDLAEKEKLVRQTLEQLK